ncbi:hypothetical protein M406DRAFT_268516 [Cryphonectria parasitica EP155]|uniref:Transglycosylase SLT domain-containing protein n=1 Tax=Cryphonectria parasitica (strain ATCC 38755 / EP155) TaxID=660469 RepID=A0A9P5CJ60_CRYP1|nr:uncharacterized protein M406DRAFT_268516 [Cryphonectria parasitica EP155]KAF3760818.1 hypothetical protein M406DRAFT_268516 [Cryphonectria parasitica EP155]
MRAHADLLLQLRATDNSTEANKGRQFTSNAPGYYSGPYIDFPAQNTWVDYSTMFNDYASYMVEAGSTTDDVGNIYTAISSVSAALGVDKQVILGIVIQESSGYVGVKTTYDADGVPTGGLMQASGCEGYDGKTNLPKAEVFAMVHCGTQHFITNLGDFGDQQTVATIYPALREYNSGSVDQGNLSIAPNGAGNPYYVSDIAQRMQGYVF